MKYLTPLGVCFYLLGQIWGGVAFAQTSPAPQAASSSSTAQQQCPAPSTLVQLEDKSWIAPDGWKSTGPSLYNAIDEFVGAQWVGVNVGEVICIYTKEGESDFPVNLQRQIVTLSPYGGSWTEDKGGYKDCKANDPAQCAFQIQVAAPEKNVYEDLDFFKNKPASNNSNP